jgi:hypothetical protein
MTFKQVFAWVSFVACLTLSFAPRARGEEAPAATRLAPGSYFGYIAFDHTSFRLLTRLDIARGNPTNATDGDLVAFVKVITGNIASHEYHTSYFRYAKHNWASPTFNLDANLPGNGPNLSLLNAHVSEDGTRITAVAHGRRAKHVGRVELVRANSYAEAHALLQTIFPDRFTLRPLTGEYHCVMPDIKNDERTFQIEAARMASPENLSIHAMNGYRITGRMRKKHVAEPYFWFDDGEFNIWDGFFRVPTRDMKCNITADGMNCTFRDRTTLQRGCSFKRVEGQRQFDRTAAGRPEVVSRLTDWVPSNAPERGFSIGLNEENLSGEFSGWLSLKDRQVHTKISLESEIISSTPSDSTPGELDSANISLSFKIMMPISTSDSMVYGFAFDPLTVTKNQTQNLLFVGKNDGMLVIHTWTPEVIAGEWYSKTYGHVGNLLLQRGEIESILPCENCVPETPPVGLFTSRPYELGLVAAIPPNHLIFTGFPFHIRGVLRWGNYRQPFGSTGVNSFDPFTGLLALDFEDGRIYYAKLGRGRLTGIVTAPKAVGNPWFDHVTDTALYSGYLPE